MKLDDDLCPHYLNLNFSEDFLCDDTKIQIQLPYPISKPLKNSEIDVINKYSEDLEIYNHQLTILRKDFQAVENKILDQSFSGSHATVTKGLLSFCNREKLTIPFHCDYNPYYSTGSLESFNLNGNDYLIRPDWKNILRISKIAKPWKNYKLHVETPFEENITGISLNNDFEAAALLIKHKNQINLAQVEDIKAVAKSIFTKNFKLDVLDAKINKTKVGVVLCNGKFLFYDIETDTKIDLSVLDSATRLEIIDENTVAVLSQKSLRLIDLRSTDYKLFEPEVNKCDYLCCASISNNLVYVATRHHLIRTDVRFFKNVDFCTHLMKFSPCYIDVADNFMYLSSQKMGESVLFCGNPISSLPMIVPNICDTFNEYKLQKDILLRGEIEERLKKSIGGVKIISDDKDTWLYSVNSLGDIYKQKITNNSENDGFESIENFDKWINNLPEPSKPLHLTNVVNLSEARFSLNKSIQQDRLKKFTNKPKKVNYFLNHFKNRYHKNNLGELAGNFVSIWEEPEEEEREHVDLVPEVAPRDKVSNWIESSYFFD